MKKKIFNCKNLTLFTGINDFSFYTSHLNFSSTTDEQTRGVGRRGRLCACVSRQWQDPMRNWVVKSRSREGGNTSYPLQARQTREGRRNSF